MASRKEYEMLFALNAQLNGGFNSTFSKAQSEFSKLGKEIQSLRSLQADVSAYQKQQNAIQATTAKLQNLQKQHDLLQKEIGETSESTEALEREKLKLEQRISDTSTRLEQQKQKLEATGAKLKEAGVDTSNLSQKDAELTQQIKALQEEQDKAADSAASFGEKSAQAFGAIQQAIAAAGVAAALKEIAEAYQECISIAADFEETMSTVEALSGASADEMEALNAMAKELGATTKFTATESAEAMTYMAMAGWDATEMLSGMNGVLQLAAASGEDLALVSDIVTDNLTAFGLTAADTAHFSDVLAAAATNSNTSVSIMGETFKNCAAIAGALNYSIDDVAVAVGLMANAGVKGSNAGTALKNTFNGLLSGVTLTGSALGEYEFTAVKADGTMKDFASTIDELRACFDQMTEAERVENAQAIAGERTYNGLLAILNATDEEYASLSASIADCSGAAATMAAIKLDNLNGELTLMNSAWDALKTTIGEQFIPEMRTLYSVGTDVFGVLDNFAQQNPGLVKGVTLFIGVIGAAIAILTAYAAVTKIAAAASALLTAAIPGVNIIMGVTAAVAAVAGAIYGIATAANAGVPSVKELTEAARDMREAMDEANATYEETATQTLATAQVASTYIDKLEEIEAATGGAVAGNQEYHNILALLTRTVPELADSIDLTTDTIVGGTEALRAHTEAWKKDAETQAYQEYLNSLYDEYSAVMTESAENSIKLTQAQIKLETAEKNRDAALERMNELSQEAYEQGGMLTQEYYDLQNSLYGYNDEINQAEKTIKNLNKAMAEDADAVAAAEAEINDAEDAVARLTGVTEEQTAAAAEAAQQEQALQSVIGSVTEKIAALTDAYNDAYNAAFESVSGQYDLWDKAEKVVATSAGSINSALESQITYWDNYNQNLESLRDRTADIEGLSDVIASFADGSQESVNAIAGMASASDEDLAAMVQNWQALQQAQADASQSIADLKTDFSTQMDELQAELESDIEAMDMGTEAAASGKSTIQGFIDGAAGMQPQVEVAYAKIAQAAIAAIDKQLDIHSPSRVMMEKAEMTWAGYINQTQAMEPEVQEAMAGAADAGVEAFDAEQYQVAAVAPQLFAALNAYNAKTTAADFYPSGNSPGSAPPIQVIFQIAGNATPETVEALREYGDEFAERVLEVIEQHGADVARRAYQ